MRFFNRCRIASATGALWLTVPLQKGRDQRGTLGEIRIDQTRPWQREHLRTLESCYSRAPFFDHYFDEVKNVILSAGEFLWELDLLTVQWVVGAVSATSEIRLNENRQFIEGPGNDHQEAGNLPGPLRRYPQVFEDRTGFLEGLSILDLVFCIGPAARDFLIGTDDSPSLSTN